MRPAPRARPDSIILRFTICVPLVDIDVLAGIMRCSRNMKIDTSQFTMVGDEAYVREGALYLCTAARKLRAC